MDVNILKARCIIEYELLIKYSNELGIDTGYNDDKFLKFKDEINAFLKSGAFYIALTLAILIVAGIIFLLVFNHKKKK